MLPYLQSRNCNTHFQIGSFLIISVKLSFNNISVLIPAPKAYLPRAQRSSPCCNILRSDHCKDNLVLLNATELNSSVDIADAPGADIGSQTEQGNIINVEHNKNQLSTTSTL